MAHEVLARLLGENKVLKRIAFLLSKYDLTRIKSGPNNVLINFNNYIHGYSANVRDIIENRYFMRSVGRTDH